MLWTDLLAFLYYAISALSRESENTYIYLICTRLAFNQHASKLQRRRLLLLL